MEQGENYWTSMKNSHFSLTCMYVIVLGFFFSSFVLFIYVYPPVIWSWNCVHAH